MKEVHLICNAHLDPVWQWEWEEGAAAALSTFRTAADLADEFDYIFCHNEVTLYKYIEEYAPALFQRIRELIRIGKWHIIGGWYLQPDCNMPQGESFIRQIQVGHRYFMDKFGENPTTAINFDAFGHTRGLVQIMKKCGQDSCILCRPGNDPIPAIQFLWEGFDGSRIKVNAGGQGYNSPLGSAADAIRGKANQPGDVVCALWGVGNHGGGPSRKDLADIDKLIAEGSMKILHSTPETFFAQIDPQVVHAQSLRISNPGCYTTMVRIKQKHAELENNLYMTEKLCSSAALRGLIEYPEEELNTVVEDLLNAEFHDILPGSSVRAGENNGLTFMEHALLILNRLRARAYFAMTAIEPRAKEGEYPILVFNPNPYEWTTEITCELSLADQNWSDTMAYIPRVVDGEGRPVPAQITKEESNLSLDWRKRIVFRASLKPLTVTRYSIYMDLLPKPEKVLPSDSGDIVVDLPDLGKHVEIDGQTGLLRSYRLNGKEYIATNAFRPDFYEDNPDPWAMGGFQLSGMGRNPKPFTLMKKPDGPFTGMKSVQLIDDGDLYTAIEAFFLCENTRVRIEYRIYKHNDAMDVIVDTFLNDANRMLKLAIPTTVQGEYIGQTAFGTEPLYMDGRECVAQRFVAVRDKDPSNPCLVLFNQGTYGSSFENSTISMSLARSAAYCAHPIGDRPIIPTDRYVKRIDLGERTFRFRLTVAQEAELERLAVEYNMPPYACNVFPLDSGDGVQPFDLTIADQNITLVTMKKRDRSTTYLLRLFNGYDAAKSTTVTLNNTAISLNFGKYEVKTIEYNPADHTLTELDQLVI